MSEPFLGQITIFGGNFAPRGYALCDGQLLVVNQNSALFSLLGTTYGGDGRTTFALPDLRSRLPVHVGQGAGLSKYNLGQSGGSTSVTIDTNTMPSHMHSLNATKALANDTKIGNGVILAQATGDSAPLFYAAPKQGEKEPTPVAMATDACGTAGGGQPHTNLMPSLCVTFIIALQGLFPSRN